MNYSLKITPQEVYKVSVLKTGKAAEVAENTRFANSLTFEVRSSWKELPPEVQDALKRFAYSEPSKARQNLAERLRSLRNHWRLTDVLRKHPELMRDFLNSVSNLTEAVLDAVEQENSKYQEDLAEAIEETLSDTNRRTMNAEEAREWNRQIFDRAFE